MCAANIPLSVALGGRNCGIWNVLQGERAAESALDKRKIHIWAQLASCKRIDQRSMMKNHAIQQPLASSSFGEYRAVAVSDGRTLWQHQRAFQICWCLSIPSQRRPDGRAVDEFEPGTRWLSYGHGRPRNRHQNAFWPLDRFWQPSHGYLRRRGRTARGTSDGLSTRPRWAAGSHLEPRHVGQRESPSNEKGRSQGERTLLVLPESLGSQMGALWALVSAWESQICTLSPQIDPWVPHISLVFCEMWDTTNVDYSPLKNVSEA